MKVTINLPDNALRLADEGAARMCLSRSAFIALCIAEKCKQDSFVETLPKMIAELQAMREREAAKSEDDGAPLT